MAMPKLQKRYDDFNDNGINIIGISVGDKSDKPQLLVEKRAYIYDCLLDGDDLAKTLKFRYLPHSFCHK